MRKFKIGDRVIVPVRENRIWDFTSSSDTIDTTRIVHGSTVLDDDNPLGVGKIIGTGERDYLVSVKTEYASDSKNKNSKLLSVQLIWDGGCLKLHKPRDKSNDKNLFNIDDL